MYRQNQSASREAHSVKPPRGPERPLTPYMRFSRKMWPKTRQEHPDSPTWSVGKKIKQLWQDMPDSEKSVFQQEYELERVDYEKALKAYLNSSAYQQYLIARTRVKPNEKVSSTTSRKSVNAAAATSDPNNVTGVIIQPVDDEDPFEMTGKRLFAVRYDRNNRLMLELFSPNYLPDSRTVIPQQRVEQQEKQRSALKKHQQKLDDDLREIEQMFGQRKRSIERASQLFDDELKRVCEDRPQPTEKRYNSLVDEWQSVLLKSYEDYKKRQAAIRARLEAERRETPVLYSLTCGKSPSPESPMQSQQAMSSQANGLQDNEDTSAIADRAKQQTDVLVKPGNVATDDRQSKTEDEDLGIETENIVTTTTESNTAMDVDGPTNAINKNLRVEEDN